MTDESESRFRDQLREGLQQAEESLSPRVMQALQQARSNAVEAAARKTVYKQPLAWAGGFAAIVVAVVLSVQIGGNSLQESMLEDMAMLAAEEELELYQELEFYNWLSESELDG